MRVLRSNKDSVMAMLEAFVHDPLINWRLLNTTTDAVDAGNTPTGDSSKSLAYGPWENVYSSLLAVSRCNIALCSFEPPRQPSEHNPVQISSF